MSASSRMRWVTCLDTPGLLVLLSLLVLVTPGTAQNVATSGSLLRDSAGVRIVESAVPRWSEGRPWTVATDPHLTLESSEEESAPVLFGVVDAFRLEGGAVVVASAGGHVVHWFDRDGAFQYDVGREGEGPGEFMRVLDLYRCSGDTLVVNEGLRLSRLAPDGGFLSARRATPEPEDRGGFRIGGLSDDCKTVLIVSARAQQPEEGSVVRTPVTLYWRGLETDDRDTLGVFPLEEVKAFERGGEAVSYGVPWGTRTHWTVANGRAYVATSDRPEVRVFGRDGRLREMLRYRPGLRSIDSADRESFADVRRSLAEEYPQFRGRYRLPHLADFPQRERRPLNSGVLVDPERNVWLRHYPETGAGWTGYIAPWDRTVEPETWTVLDSSGQWLGAVEMPQGLEVLSISGTEVIGVWRDRLDRESIHIHGLRKEKAPGEGRDR